MSWLHEYLKFISTLDAKISNDVRVRMESYDYDTFCARINKSLRHQRQQAASDDYF